MAWTNYVPGLIVSLARRQVQQIPRERAALYFGGQRVVDETYRELPRNGLMAAVRAQLASRHCVGRALLQQAPESFKFNVRLRPTAAALKQTYARRFQAERET